MEPISISTLSINDILNEFKQKSNNLKYRGFNLLSCAIYGGNTEKAYAVVQYYKSTSELEAQLGHINPVTGENILHVALKHSEIMDLICNVIQEENPSLFEKLVNEEDKNGDTFFHKAAELGRTKSLAVLFPYLQKHVSSFSLHVALQQENNQRETCSEIAEHYNDSNTIKAFSTSGLLTQNDIEMGRQHCFEIETMFERALLGDNQMRISR